MNDAGPRDAQEIHAVHTAAFGQPDEAQMVEAVVAAGDATISLVARAGGQVGGQVVGHVLFSPVHVDGLADTTGLGLAPLAVHPDHQRSGVGTQLTEAGLHRARLLGHGFVVVLGHPTYYPRFGFRPASQLGLRYSADVPDDVFMALELRKGALPASEGGGGCEARVVHYHRAFS